MTTCIASVIDCADCERASRSRRSPGHRCDDLCRLIARNLADDEGHAAWHRANRCSDCGAWKDDEAGRFVADVRPCRFGNCREFYCPNCGAEWMSDGPVGCPCDRAGWFTRLRWRALSWWHGAAGRRTKRIARGAAVVAGIAAANVVFLWLLLNALISPLLGWGS